MPDAISLALVALTFLLFGSRIIDNYTFLSARPCAVNTPPLPDGLLLPVLYSLDVISLRYEYLLLVATSNNDDLCRYIPSSWLVLVERSVKEVRLHPI